MSASDSNLNASADPRDRRPGCLVCRSRKIRCDKSVPNCRKCSRLGVTCPGYEPVHGSMSRTEMLRSTEEIFKAAGIDKRRIGSCHQCRSSKSRCTRTRPTCQRCRSKRLNCVYESSAVSHSEISSTSPSDLASHGRPVELLPSNHGLYTDVLPEDPASFSLLIDTYFDRIHYLKSLAFIHKPSFMHSMARATVVEDYGEPLLYVMCALSARCIYLDKLNSSKESAAHLSPVPGDLWAQRARKIVLDEIHRPTEQQIMAMILLCEYGLRTEQNSLVFMLCGCLYRATRLLGLDNAPQDLRAASQLSGSLEEEVHHRLVWASYTIDILLSSGVDKNSSWREDLPQVPLPCSDRDFLLQTPSPMRFLSDADGENMAAFVKDLDMLALVTMLVRLRGKVLRLIRTAPPADTHIFDSGSPFMLLLREVDAFYENLPDRFQLTELNTYIHKDQHTIGALFSFHLMYHAAIFDLTRISMAGFDFPLAGAFQNAPPQFRSQCQERCHFHALAVSDLIRQGIRIGRAAFDDSFCADAALESSKVQIIYTATVANDVQTTEKTRENLRTTLRLFELLHPNQDGGSTYVRILLSLCVVFGFRDIAEEWRDFQTLHRVSPEVTGPAKVHHLANFAPFRRAQTEIQARQTESPRTPSSSGDPAERCTRRSDDRRPRINAVDGAVLQRHSAEQLSSTPSLSQPETHGQVLQTVMAQDLSSTQIQIPGTEMLHPSVEDYIRTATEMSDLLTWNMSELPDVPLWTDFEGQNPGPSGD
ncbi:hypothetical protein C8A03DRAFT_47227 [Achaetomium macrosporum]|uniref:Zn(2)-C6 fungal-type domain-containing protein n=1 Tax=Achaetomium macrosporum TaxID=79813 RepID=A0AAN7H7Q9_9PEZI|nr:hypothetical protein C8A03DRAFT_47227 [Achaetomium macrosporum]